MPTVSPSIHAEGSPTAAPTQLSWRIVRQTRGSTPVNVTDACHVDAGCISDGEGRYGAREACTFEAVVRVAASGIPLAMSVSARQARQSRLI